VDVVVELSDDDTAATTIDNGDEMGIGETIRLLADPSTFSFEQLPSYEKGSQEACRKQPKLRLRIHRYIGGFVAINNETVTTPNAIINEGDILSLQSMSYSYDYVVMMAPISDSTTSATKTAPNSLPLSVSPSENDSVVPSQTESATHQQRFIDFIDHQQKLLQQMVNDEFTCAICLEYQVQSTALVPCGHSFCNTCIVDSEKKKLKIKICSVCNTKITTVVPNRTIDSCFHLMVQFQSEQNKKLQEEDDETLSSSFVPILPQEDLQHYMERSEQQTSARMNIETKRRSKRQRPTHDAAPPMPPTAPTNIDDGPMARLQAMMFPNIRWEGNPNMEENINEIHHPGNAVFHMDRLYPRTPAVVANGGRPTAVSLLHGSTPTDAIEID
jgi:hypothetical protein